MLSFKLSNCKLETAQLSGKSKIAGNKSINANFFIGGLSRQKKMRFQFTFVLNEKVALLKPPKQKLLLYLDRWL